jgi:plasmid stabilization system protein ParE
LERRLTKDPTLRELPGAQDQLFEAALDRREDLWAWAFARRNVAVARAVLREAEWELEDVELEPQRLKGDELKQFIGELFSRPWKPGGSA